MTPATGMNRRESSEQYEHEEQREGGTSMRSGEVTVKWRASSSRYAEGGGGLVHISSSWIS